MNLLNQEYWASSKFGKLRMEIPIAISAGSSSKPVSWICDCGNTFLKPVFWVSTGKITSCGRCNWKESNYWENTKFGKLRMEFPIEISSGSSQKVTWICDCGKRRLNSVTGVTSGYVTSCGRCDWEKSDYWMNTKFGKLQMEHPIEIHKRSARRVSWICDCGNKTIVSVLRVTTGITSSCNKCNWKKPDYWKDTKFGKLRIKSPIYMAPHSDKKEEWICDCGNMTRAVVHHVFSGNISSCGKCHIKPTLFWRDQKFGKLRMKHPNNYHLKSNKKIEWLCDCGNETIGSIAIVTNGRKASCGKCYERAIEWYLKNREVLLKLKTPINQNQIPGGWISLNKDINQTKQSVSSICGACKSEYFPRWKDIRRGISLTCGCTTYKISFSHRAIGEFIKSLGIDVKYEQKIGDYKYDLFVPSANLLIEYNGIRWHSFPQSKRRDITKYKNAINHDYKYLYIYEDEWLFKCECIRGFIKNRLNISNTISLRPSVCEIKSIKSNMADEFYNKHHYIGAVKARINYGIFYKNNLIACASFKHPTRQSKYNWELSRISSNSIFHVHGIWSKILKLFISQYKPSNIVTFSDNRLFTGKLYEKIGFKLDSEIRSDYYWANGHRRFHKSKLRKTILENKSGLTETQLRESQGYRKIWDLGKKRWVLEL